MANSIRQIQPDWSKCQGNPYTWDPVEREKFRNLRFRDGKIFLIPLQYFNEYLDHNPSYINIEMRSLISHHYKGFGNIALLLFNPQDILMFQLIAGNNVKTKINDFQYMWCMDNRYPYKSQVIKWVCGSYTEYHPIMNDLISSERKKIWCPGFAESSSVYTVKSCKVTHSEFFNNVKYGKKWRSELEHLYYFQNIKSFNDKELIVKKNIERRKKCD